MGTAMFQSQNLLTTQEKYVQAEIGSKVYQLEISNTAARRYLGLSYRKSLDKDKGMIFVFPKPGYHQFCMREMNFALDFIWVNGDEVVDLTEDVPPPSVSAVGNFGPDKKVDKIIELNAGEIKESQVKIGDRIHWEL